MSARPASPHLIQTAVVLDEVRLLYVPVPKAGSTAMLWALAELAGLEAGDFERSRKLEVTRPLTVHDPTVWGRSRTLDGRSAGELEQLLSSADWFRFTIVRDPLPRLWSAWVSKILVRDPRFVAAYGNEGWFPSPPETSQDVIDAFRRFARVLPTRPRGWHDPHWGPQSDLVAIKSIRYDLVGRVEQIDRVAEAVNDYLRARGRSLQALRRENPALLPFTPALLDPETLEACELVVQGDREAFGYEPPSISAGEPDDAWRATVEANLGAIRAVIERNERIGDLRGLLADSRRQRSVGRRLLRRTVGGS